MRHSRFGTLHRKRNQTTAMEMKDVKDRVTELMNTLLERHRRGNSEGDTLFVLDFGSFKRATAIKFGM